MNNQLSYNLAAKTDKGRRRDHNEDTFMLCPNLVLQTWTKDVINKNISLGSKGGIFIVSDGMGGTNGGAIASDISIKAFEKVFAQLPKIQLRTSFFKKYLYEALQEGHNNIRRKANGDESLKKMGTTCVVAWLFEDNLFVAWIGDSRVYLFDSSNQFKLLTKDHSKVQEKVDIGKITQEQAFFDKEKNVITESLGDPNRKPNPDFLHFKMKKKDKFLLCSDGLNDMLQDHEISTLFENSASVNYLVGDLIDSANQKGGLDNITAVVGEIVSLPSVVNTIVVDHLSRKETSQSHTNPIRTNQINTEKPTGINWIKLMTGILITLSLCLLGYCQFINKPSEDINNLGTTPLKEQAPAPLKKPNNSSVIIGESSKFESEFEEKKREIAVAEEAERKRIAVAEEAERKRIAVAEEAERKRIAVVEEAERKRIATAESDKGNLKSISSAIQMETITKEFDSNKYYIQVQCNKNEETALEAARNINKFTPNAQPVVIKNQCEKCSYHVVIGNNGGYANKEAAIDAAKKAGYSGDKIVLKPCK